MNYNALGNRPTEIIIFILGGATYEEAKEIGLLNKQSIYYIYKYLK